MIFFKDFLPFWGFTYKIPSPGGPEAREIYVNSNATIEVFPLRCNGLLI